ncbi:MAG: aspartate kinase [Clostridia bacterium]|nr:aspartate kinase [Clostridia bacterium]
MLIVQKYGGSSVADSTKLFNVASRIANTVNEGNSVVVVVSAQGKTTDYLINLSKEINLDASKRELDMLLATGEQQSAALLTMTLEKLGINAISMNAYQAGIHSTNTFGNAKIKSINPGRILKELETRKVVVVAGFQGIDEIGNITTLGRGGSDTTAVALAAALKADRCDIYSDVDGIYTADPRVVTDAVKLDSISFDEMLELASMGAKVLNNRAVELAKKSNTVIMSASSFSDAMGTYVKDTEGLEDVNVKGVAGDKNIVVVTVLGVKANSMYIYKIFSLLARENISVDVIVQCTNNVGTVDVSFTVKRTDAKDAINIINENMNKIEATGLKVVENCAKVSAVGAGMVNNPGVAAGVFEALYENNINIYLVSTSEVKISAIIDESNLELAMNAIHKKFNMENLH